MSNRDEAMAKYSGLYSLFRPEKYGCEQYYRCVYCGDPSDSIDHQPPITRVSEYRCLNLANELFITVPCCRECNLILSDLLTASLVEREMLCKNKLADKYKKLLKCATWTKDDFEYAKLRGMLKKYVEGHAKQKKLIEERISYFEGMKAFMRFVSENNIVLPDDDQWQHVKGKKIIPGRCGRS